MLKPYREAQVDQKGRIEESVEKIQKILGKAREYDLHTVVEEQESEAHEIEPWAPDVIPEASEGSEGDDAQEVNMNWPSIQEQSEAKDQEVESQQVRQPSCKVIQSEALDQEIELKQVR